MNETSTSREAVEQLAAVFARRGPAGGGAIAGTLYGTVAATLRALLARAEQAEANRDAVTAAWQSLHNATMARAIAAETELAAERSGR